MCIPLPKPWKSADILFCVLKFNIILSQMFFHSLYIAYCYEIFYHFSSRMHIFMGSKFPKSWTFETPILKLAVCPLNIHNLKFKWSIVIRQTEYKINQRTYYYLPNSAFWGWLSMESQPQNPEFRNNPENFHPCIFNVNYLVTSKLLIEWQNRK